MLLKILFISLCEISTSAISCIHFFLFFLKLIFGFLLNVKGCIESVLLKDSTLLLFNVFLGRLPIFFSPFSNILPGAIVFIYFRVTDGYEILFIVLKGAD